jgi:hypothetical protein
VGAWEVAVGSPSPSSSHPANDAAARRIVAAIAAQAARVGIAEV